MRAAGVGPSILGTIGGAVSPEASIAHGSRQFAAGPNDRGRDSIDAGSEGVFVERRRSGYERRCRCDKWLCVEPIDSPQKAVQAAVMAHIEKQWQ